MKSFYKKKYVFFLFLIIIYSCNKETVKYERTEDNYKYANDSLFLESIDISKKDKELILSEQYYFTTVIAEKLIFHQLEGCGCFIKEITKSGINRFYYKFQTSKNTDLN